MSLYDDTHHGLTLCSGSLGCATFNDMPHLIRKYGKQKRIHFAHVRNIKILEDGSFEEVLTILLVVQLDNGRNDESLY